jgi:two-component system sensor kinase FixL
MRRSVDCRITSTGSVAANDSSGDRSHRLGSGDLEAARARSIVDRARDAVISITSAGAILDFNRAAERMFGYEAAEVVGSDVSVLMPSPDRERHAEYISRYERTGEARAIGRIRDVRALRKNGETFPAELAISEVRVGGDRIYTAIIRDVSAYRAATESLKRERDFSERLIETTPFIVLVLDREARIVRFNRRMSEITGYGLAEVHNENWFERFIPPRDEDRVQQVFSRAVSGRSVRGNVNAILTKTGEQRIIRWYAEPLRDPEGRIESVLCGGEDITEQVRASEEVQRLARIARERERLADLGAIAARLVHDLGNPISGLSMQAQLLMRRVRKQRRPVSDPLLQPAERILHAVERLNTLIRGFMDFAREQRLEIEDVDIADLARSVLDLWAAQRSDGGGVALELECEPKLGTVRGDESKLRRVLENLVKNAIDAIGDRPGVVRVTIDRPQPGRVRISVADDGPGVAADVDVFCLFETTKPQGTGIGLAVAKQIVVAHGGGIDFANVEPHGAVFSIDLPVEGPPGAGGDSAR